MRKLKTFIYFFITFIFLSTPIKAKASSVALTTESLNLLNSGIDFLSYSGSVPYGFIPFVFSSEKNYQDIIENRMDKQDVFNVNGTPNITIRPLTTNEYSLLENAFVYDDDGNIVSLQELYYGECDNGYFTEKFYCKNDGSIVYQNDDKTNPYLDVKFGGSELSYLQWQNVYSSLSNDIESSDYNLNSDGNPVNSVSYYIYYGENTYSSGYPCVYLYIANQYQRGVIIPDTSRISQFNNGVTQWYTNDLSLFSYGATRGDLGTRFRYTQGSYTIDGYTYNYLVTFANNLGFYGNINYNSPSDWLASGPSGNGLFAKTGYYYNSALFNTNTESFRKIITDNDSIDFSKAYSYSAIEDYVGTIDSVIPYPDSTFDPTASITALNYPIIYDVDTDVSDVVIPFPDSVVIDDSPAIEYPLDDTIDATLITDNIPIISGLENKFPFSIPWDIYNLVNGLSVTREIPAINYTVEIPIINYDWEIDLDLSMYDESAELFRKLFLILFIIGLAVFSYQHFFGS